MAPVPSDVIVCEGVPHTRGRRSSHKNATRGPSVRVTIKKAAPGYHVAKPPMANGGVADNQVVKS